MKRLFRILLNAATVMSLLLCLASMDLWVRSQIGAARRVLGILVIAILGIALSAQHTSAAVIFSKIADTTTTAPGQGAFTGFGSLPTAAPISGSNVAFRGDYSGGSGIYLATGGAGGSLSAVLNTGDALFGSTVSSFNLGGFAYDNNAIAFEYSLADGRSGVAVASVPEPGGLGLLGVVFAALLRRRRPERGAVSDSGLPRRE